MSNVVTITNTRLGTRIIIRKDADVCNFIMALLPPPFPGLLNITVDFRQIETKHGRIFQNVINQLLNSTCYLKLLQATKKFKHSGRQELLFFSKTRTTM